MLEKMAEFFEARLDGYDVHMKTNIESAEEFYPFTAECLPRESGCRVLDLGCGTGLELEDYFQRNPDAAVTGIDLSGAMLDALKIKFPNRQLNLICGSYFNVCLGENYDAAVSVESLHQFTMEEKLPLYTRLYNALKPNGYFILTDYFSQSEEEETFFRGELLRLKQEQGICDDEFYHYDTPLTVEHEIQTLLAAGFRQVEVMNHWGSTYTLRAVKD